MLNYHNIVYVKAFARHKPIDTVKYYIDHNGDIYGDLSELHHTDCVYGIVEVGSIYVGSLEDRKKSALKVFNLHHATGEYCLSRANLLSFLKGQSHTNAFNHLTKQWKNHTTRSDDDRVGQCIHSYINDGPMRIPKWFEGLNHEVANISSDRSDAIVFKVNVTIGSTDESILIGYYLNDACSVTDVLTKEMTAKVYLSLFENPPEEFSYLFE